jgi:hypothetical protein
MIPPFDDNGYLPPGVHPATLEEIAARFGRQSEIRQVQMDSLGWLVDLAWRAGIQRLVINGSFVTDAEEPNDVDCLLLIDDAYPQDAEADGQLQEGLPFLQLIFVQQPDFDWYVRVQFATDRDNLFKGMVEVMR